MLGHLPDLGEAALDSFVVSGAGVHGADTEVCPQRLDQSVEFLSAHHRVGIQRERQIRRCADAGGAPGALTRF
ncbi:MULTISPECIES: hypothetical protein [Prauserella salsuginis group]|uniref:Uncharacterized protein n=1 Tax=Prauserella salsuginis TaxID=387889 RepID=A0ABW6G106_9PSEU|nr:MULTISPECIES: hypothetical protein [Prauserella salsuginis group]